MRILMPPPTELFRHYRKKKLAVLKDQFHNFGHQFAPLHPTQCLHQAIIKVKTCPLSTIFGSFLGALCIFPVISVVEFLLSSKQFFIPQNLTITTIYISLKLTYCLSFFRVKYFLRLRDRVELLPNFIAMLKFFFVCLFHFWTAL